MRHNEIFVSETSGITYSSVLEEGDYIPYFIYRNGFIKISIQNSAGKPNLFIIIDKCTEEIFKKYTFNNISTYIICNQTTYNHSHIISNNSIYRLFPQNKIILVTSNLKIHKIYNLNTTSKSILETIKNFPSRDPPIIIVPNVITNKFKDELIEMFNKSTNKNIELKGNKSRTHVYLDRNITNRLDDKLTKSLFPEIKKIFNLDVTHRENYKICGYSEKDHGKFHAHRDSVYPYGHRRLAMSLVLNDDYEGGIIFPEYNNTIYKPTPCSAVIFPTSLFHQVLEVTKGIRYVIISFLLGDDEAKYKKRLSKHQGKICNIDQYKIKIQRDQRNLLIDDICPQK